MPTNQAPRPQIEPLKAERIQAFLREHPEWKVRGESHALVRTFGHPGRNSAQAFATWLAEFTRDYGHSARLELYDNVVTVTLATPVAGGVTEKDLGLARELEFRL